jgi:NAD(P)-dependent dehydrogenase (short-subunit alcohol dehydrogenase family)
MSQPFIQFDSDYVALVSAGASGIGRVISETMLSLGAKVHVCDISQTSIDAFLKANPAATATLCDVAKFAQVTDVFTELGRQYGKLDLLVNNAGIAGPTALVQDIDPKEWCATINVDLNAQFYFTKLAVPILKANKSGGSIINMSSNAGLLGLPLRSAYTAAKWALVGLTKTWAMELGEHNIRVNALCPGSVEGPRIDGVIERDANARGVSAEQVRAIYQSQSSMRLFVSPQDVANMVVFLASSLGKSISGQSIGIDGHTESLSTFL